jgi:hypothetical protein
MKESIGFSANGTSMITGRIPRSYWMTTNSMDECGTMKGAWRHLRRKEKLSSCDLCREEYNEYHRERRKVTRNKLNFHKEAVAILIIRHEQEFADIIKGIEDGTI